MTSLVDHVSGELLGLLNQLVSAANELGRAISPSRLAGDPAALRSAAAAWRRQHDEVRSIGSQLFSQVQDVLNGSWQGEASQAFAAQWQATSSQLEDFLASQLRVADSLEQAADRSAALNGQAVTLAHEIRALVSTLQSSGDPSVVIGMAGDGWDLLRRKDDLLHQTLSNWAAYEATLAAINLFFQHMLQQARPIQPQQAVVPYWDLRPEFALRPRLEPGGEMHVEASPSGRRSGGVGVMPTNPAADPNWIIAAIIAAAAAMAARGAIEGGAFLKLLDSLTSNRDRLTRAEDSHSADGSSKGRRDRTHDSYDRAREAAQGEVGDKLGENPERMYDPETGTVVGEQSADGKAGWRADHGHFNWWDWTAGKKGSGGRYGHDYFPENQTGPHSKYPGDLPWGAS